MQEPDLRIKAKKASSNDLTATSKLRVKTHIDNVIYFSSSTVSFVLSTYSIIMPRLPWLCGWVLQAETGLTLTLRTKQIL